MSDLSSALETPVKRGIASNKRDVLSSTVFLVLGLLALFSSLLLGVGDVGDPGSGFVLFYVSLLFLGCIALLLVFSHQRFQGTVPSEAWHVLPRRPVSIVVAASVVYPFVLERLGYLLATFAFMLLLFGFNRMKLWLLVTSAASTVAASYYLFHNLLQVPLPKGLLGF